MAPEADGLADIVEGRIGVPSGRGLSCKVATRESPCITMMNMALPMTDVTTSFPTRRFCSSSMSQRYVSGNGAASGALDTAESASEKREAIFTR